MSWSNYRYYRKYRNLRPEDYDLIESQLRRRKRPEDIAADTGWSTWTIGRIAATKNYDDYRRQSREAWEKWKKENVIAMTADEMRSVYRKNKTR
jgi:hypothetical protein